MKPQLNKYLLLLSFALMLSLFGNDECKAQGLSDDTLLTLINQQPALSDGQLKNVLIANSPLSDTMLLATTQRNPALAPGILQLIMDANKPLSDEVLIALLSITPPLPSGIYKNILLANTPLSDSVLCAMIDICPMTLQHIEQVLVANAPLSESIISKLFGITPVLPLDFLETILTLQNCNRYVGIGVRYWISDTNSNFNDKSNWSYVSGGIGGACVPGSLDLAIFDQNGLGNCTFDTAISVKGLLVDTNYIGQIENINESLSIGNQGLSIFNGTFINSNDSLFVEGDMITLQNSSYVNNGGTIQINGNMSMFGKFSPNNSTIIFSGENEQIFETESIDTLQRIILEGKSLKLMSELIIGNELIFNNGKIFSDSINILTFLPNTTAINQNDQNHVEGPVKKVGGDNFIFPIGKGGKYAPLIINPLDKNTTSILIAEYFSTQQSLSNSKDSAIVSISTCEYWRFEEQSGNTNSGTISISWRNSNCFTNEVSKLRIVGLSDFQWKNIGNRGFITNEILIQSYDTIEFREVQYFTLGESQTECPIAEFEIEFDNDYNAQIGSGSKMNLVNTSLNEINSLWQLTWRTNHDSTLNAFFSEDKNLENIIFSIPGLKKVTLFTTINKCQSTFARTIDIHDSIPHKAETRTINNLNTIGLGLINLVQDSSFRKLIINAIVSLGREDSSIFFFEVNQLLKDSLNINFSDIAATSILTNCGTQHDVENFICSIDSFVATEGTTIIPKLIIQNIGKEDKNEFPIIANGVEEIGARRTLTNTTWDFNNDFLATPTVMNEDYMDNNYIWILTFEKEEFPSVITNGTPTEPYKPCKLGNICGCVEARFDPNGNMSLDPSAGCSDYQFSFFRCGEVTGGKGSDSFSPGCWGGGCGGTINPGGGINGTGMAGMAVIHNSIF